MTSYTVKIAWLLMPILVGLCVLPCLAENKEAADLMQKGSAAMKDQKLDEAIGFFTKAIALDPSLDNAYVARGACLEATGKQEKALEDWDKGQQVRLDAKLKPLTAAIQAKPGDAGAYRARALVYETYGRGKEAVADLQKAVEIAPDNLAFRCDLALAQAFLLHDVAAAQKTADALLAAAEQALKQNPNDVIAHAARVYTYSTLKVGAPRAAEIEEQCKADLSFAIEHRAGNAFVVWVVSVLTDKAGKHQEAISYIYGAFTVAKDPVLLRRFWNLRGGIHEAVGEHQPALDDYGKAIENDGSDVTGYLNVAQVFLRAGQPQRAVALVQRGVAFAPNWADALALRGAVYAAVGEPKAGLRDLDRAIELDATRPQYHFDRATAYARSGDTAHALADFNEAVKLLEDKSRLPVAAEFTVVADGSLGECYRARADARQKSGDAAGAKADLALAAKLDPDGEALANPDDGSVVKITTAKGDITLVLYDQKAPVTVGNFLNLVKKGFYDGLAFHRCIEDFMIQGGDPKGDGSGGPGYRIPDEFHRALTHQIGTISMANAGPGTGGSQFFICRQPQPHLNGKHNVFGTVTAGLDVIYKIVNGDKMTKVTVVKESPYAADAMAKAKQAQVAGD